MNVVLLHCIHAYCLCTGGGGGGGGVARLVQEQSLHTTDLLRQQINYAECSLLMGTLMK